MDLLRDYQLDIMLILTGICVLLLFFSVAIKNLSIRNRPAFILLILSATLLLVADRYAYVFRGDTSELGYWMVRICNFCNFFSALGVVFFYNMLLKKTIGWDSGDKWTYIPLRLVDIICGIDLVLLIISQFTGLYYTFDSMNRYQRSTYSVISYALPLLCMILQISVAIRNRDRLGKRVRRAVFLFSIVPFVAGILQLFMYGVSLINITTAIMVIVLYLIALNDMNLRAEKTGTLEMDHLRDQQERMERLLNQTTTTLITALDAKEEYTQGHSARVAKYARQIAEQIGKSEEECDQIYYAGLLHDIGKIGIPDEIINKKGKLTADEYEIMKQHPVLGRQILSGITEMPYLAIGANFHHERYDGSGYPEGLKGPEIPELGRILAVADAYDAMSSNRSYRDAIPQQKIREEFIKYSGTQFDPEFAKIMQHLIDLDSEYQMKEKTDAVALTADTVITCGNYRDVISEGIFINEHPTTIRLRCERLSNTGMPALVLFDSLDAKVYIEEPLRSDMNYFEYGEIHFDGEAEASGVRRIKTVVAENSDGLEDDGTEPGLPFEVTAARYKDHAIFMIRDKRRLIKVIVAMPDNTRFLYAGITGTDCLLKKIEVETTDRTIGDGFIPRIAEEISYIKGPAGDVPNIQVDGYRTDATEGIPIRDGMTIRFHTMSLPTARLVWHTAFINIYAAEDRLVNGVDYREFALIRLDGEYWNDGEGIAENDMEVVKTDEFVDWDVWKEHNRNGFDCEVRFHRYANKVTTITTNAGIAIRNVTTIMPEAGTSEYFVALSGDQVALTNIRIFLPLT